MCLCGDMSCATSQFGAPGREVKDVWQWTFLTWALTVGMTLLLLSAFLGILK